MLSKILSRYYRIRIVRLNSKQAVIRDDMGYTHNAALEAIPAYRRRYMKICALQNKYLRADGVLL